jgi:uncharacterized membrane protein
MRAGLGVAVKVSTEFGDQVGLEGDRAPSGVRLRCAGLQAAPVGLDCRFDDPDLAGVQVDAVTAQGGQLTPAQARKRGQENERPVPGGNGPCNGKDGGKRDDWTLWRFFFARIVDTAWIPPDHLVIGGSCENCVQQPVRFGHRDRAERPLGLQACGEAFLAPAADSSLRDVSDGQLTERWQQMITQQAPVQLLAASAMLAIALGVSGVQTPHWTAESVTALVILDVLGTGFAYVLNYQIITSEGATVASTVTYLLPVVAIVLGVLVLNETITAIVLVGIAFVLIGVALTRLKKPTSKDVSAAE